jgi:hypothetical protein
VSNLLQVYKKSTPSIQPAGDHGDISFDECEIFIEGFKLECTTKQTRRRNISPSIHPQYSTIHIILKPLPCSRELQKRKKIFVVSSLRTYEHGISDPDCRFN